MLTCKLRLAVVSSFGSQQSDSLTFQNIFPLEFVKHMKDQGGIKMSPFNVRKCGVSKNNAC